MDEAEQPEAKKPLSKAPSWVLLGFVFGALTVLMLPWSTEPPAAPPAPGKTEPAIILSVPRLTTIEAQFEEYGHYAVWSNDTTEVQLWNPELKEYLDCYEVLRVGDKYYFRSIPRLTRPILTHGVPDTLTLKFTETEASKKAWEQEVREENKRTIEESLKRPVPQK